MNKIFNSKITRVFLAALIALAGIMIIFASCRLYPFGEKVFLLTDLNGQYISFFEYLRQMLVGEASWKYTISKFMGSDMAGFTSYYLLSPFNIILLLFKPENIHGAVTFIAFAKVMACAAASYIFFSSHGESYMKSIICSTAYSLGAFNLIYLQNIMWIDGVIVLPLIALGIEKIISEKKPLLYIISLFAGIFSNYYIGYMLCIFSVIYFLYKSIGLNLNVKQFFLNFFHWAFSSLLSAAMAAFVILPTLSSLEGTSKGNFGLSNLMGLETTSKLKDLAFHFFIPQDVLRDISSTLPNIYPGLIVCILATLYFLNPRIKLKNKRVSILVCIFFAASFYFWSFNLIWHGFSMPVLFYNRFSFIFTFFLVLFASSFMNNSRAADKWYVVSAAAILNFLFIVNYGISNYSTINWPDYSQFQNFYIQTEDAVNFIKEKEGNNFYRIEKNYFFGYNDPLVFGYGGMSSYSSGEKIITRRLARNMGYTVTEGRGQNLNGDCLATDSFWGVKYYIIKDDTRALTDIYSDDYVTVYENPYALPLAIQCSSDIKNMSAGEADSEKGAASILSRAFGTDLSLTKEITGYEIELENVTADDISKLWGSGAVNFSIVDPSSPAKIVYKFSARQSGSLYLNIFSNYFGAIERIVINGEDKGAYLNVDNFGTQFVDIVQQDEEIELEIILSSNLTADEIRIFYDDYSGLEAMKTEIEKREIQVSDYNVDSFTLSGYSDITNGGIMVMLPYQDGWEFVYNGKEIKPELVLDTLMYIPVEQGDFTINCKFNPPMLKTGVIISVVAAGLAVVYIILNKNKKDR